MEQYEVDCRVRDSDGFCGTVRYIGPVAAAKNKTESWLGIEWDKKDRGKHDGSCVDSEGILHRYFSCAIGAGSFVKVTNKVTAGRSLKDALKDRYVAIDAPSYTKVDDPILPGSFVTTSKGNVKPIEFHGEHKVRRYQQLDKVDAVALRNDTISTIDCTIAEDIGHVVEVDLQDNLIYKWSEVAVLTTNVSSLKTLLLHGNKMQVVTPAVLSALPAACFGGLRTLALNACNIQSWASILALEPFMPAMEELYLSSNDLSDLPRERAIARWGEATGHGSAARVESDAAGDKTGDSSSGSGSSGGDGDGGELVNTVFLSLRTSSASAGPVAADSASPSGAAHAPPGSWRELRILDMSGCQLDEWSQVLYFVALPALQELVLDSNPLTQLLPRPSPSPSPSTPTPPAEMDQAAPFFPSLSRLSISSTKLSNWSDLDALSTFPALTTLRVSHIPLFAGRGASEVRPLVIGRVRSLEHFNGSTVHARERLDAEKAYLRRALRDVEEALKAGRPMSDATLLSLHPRFNELRAKHGADLLPMGGGQIGGNIASELISVTFNNLSFAGGGSNDPVVKKLPVSITVDRLKMMVKQLFNLDTQLQQLSVLLYKDAPPTLLDDDQATLSYYGVQDGVKLYINEAKAGPGLSPGLEMGFDTNAP